MKRKSINAEDGTLVQSNQIELPVNIDATYNFKPVYRDRVSGNRDGCSVIAWYLQPLPDTRPSYSGTSLS